MREKDEGKVLDLKLDGLVPGMAEAICKDIQTPAGALPALVFDGPADPAHDADHGHIEVYLKDGAIQFFSDSPYAPDLEVDAAGEGTVPLEEGSGAYETVSHAIASYIQQVAAYAREYPDAGIPDIDFWAAAATRLQGADAVLEPWTEPGTSQAALAGRGHIDQEVAPGALFDPCVQSINASPSAEAGGSFLIMDSDEPEASLGLREGDAAAFDAAMSDHDPGGRIASIGYGPDGWQASSIPAFICKEDGDHKVCLGGWGREDAIPDAGGAAMTPARILEDVYEVAPGDAVVFLSDEAPALEAADSWQQWQIDGYEESLTAGLEGRWNGEKQLDR